MVLPLKLVKVVSLSMVHDTTDSLKFSSDEYELAPPLYPNIHGKPNVHTQEDGGGDQVLFLGRFDRILLGLVL